MNPSRHFDPKPCATCGLEFVPRGPRSHFCSKCGAPSRRQNGKTCQACGQAFFPGVGGWRYCDACRAISSRRVAERTPESVDPKPQTSRRGPVSGEAKALPCLPGPAITSPAVPLPREVLRQANETRIQAEINGGLLEQLRDRLATLEAEVEVLKWEIAGRERKVAARARKELVPDGPGEKKGTESLSED